MLLVTGYFFVLLLGMGIGEVLSFVMEQAYKKDIIPCRLAVRLANGILWCVPFLLKGFSADSLLSAMTASALLVLSIVDRKLFIIPLPVNAFLLFLGLAKLAFSPAQWLSYLLGFATVPLLLCFVFFVTKGRGIGGGDIKLMAASGLLLGSKGNLAAFFFGCLFASLIHLAKMKFAGAGRELAMGPYLSAGILMVLWFGR